MDISCIPKAKGFVYLAAVVDWFSRRVLAWRLSITLDIAFCVEAVEEATVKYGKTEIFNTPLSVIAAQCPAGQWIREANSHRWHLSRCSKMPISLSQ